MSQPAPHATAKKSAWQALKFTLFSISAGLIQIGFFELLSKAFHLPYWGSYLTALVASVLWNFTLNRRYTFRSDCNVPKSMALVALFYVVFTPLSTWWGSALTQIGWNEDLVLIGTMLINFVTEFLYQRFVVYRKTIDTNDVAKRAAEQEARKGQVDA
ncbi:MAG: GtrA family protein [Eubacteriales bacterium]|nr:GtrA family protein [Eubacteriales bacterium]